MIEMPARVPSWYTCLLRRSHRTAVVEGSRHTRPRHMSSTILPRRLRSFHLPGPCGDFMSGELHVSGPGRVLFPSSPVSTVVRTLPVATDRILWLRSFGGKTFLQSTYHYSSESNEQPLHDVEYLFPLSFQFDWTAPSIFVDGSRVSPKHIRTRLFDVLPLPLGLVSVRLEMALLAEGTGWDLVADVRLLGTIPLVCYKGTMRELTSASFAEDKEDKQDADGGCKEEEEGPTREQPPPRYVPSFHTLVLFDGECNLCNASVDFAIRRDYLRRLVFAPQQNPAAVEALRRAGHEPPAAMGGDDDDGGGRSADTVLVLSPDGRLHERSSAALNVGLTLDWPWPLLAGLGFLVPAFVRDAIYDCVGRNRIRWFGARDTCRLPTASERRRFL
jgi:predicted DCC family thiol-disulfide oxidoreductase YuxK